ncbi:MAG: serine--tRNA ligase [Elusimicrobia bacterium]|nr:serine--tRNA ligase [Elusimicrobiota bacterium]
MNDFKILRSDPEGARRAMRNRSGRYAPYLEEFYRIDEEHRSLLQEVETLRAKRNSSSEDIAKAKKSRDETRAQSLMQDVSQLKKNLQEKEGRLEGFSGKLRECLLSIPNIPHASVPVGKEESENVEKRKGKAAPRQFNFKPRDHQTIGERLGILDPVGAAKLSGARFSLLWGAGARLERALIGFMLDLHVGQHGYVEAWPPYLVRPEILEGTGQLPKFREDMYCTRPSGQDEQDYGEMFLISTAEVPLTNLVREEVLDPARLPLRYTAFTPCFRQEAGSYGKDTRGLIRVHQFDKVELVWITRPEGSMEALEALTHHAERVLELLDIPYRVIELCTADLGFASCKSYDLEVWMPSEGRYREISSCSNCWDFQARRMNARMRKDPKSAPEFVHTLNGSGVAVGRLFAAILENFQREDGSVEIPQALQSYFGSADIRV